MSVTVYRSTDANAPILTAAQGSLVALLDACLVAGYGSVRATGTITQSGQPSNNETITVGGTTYTFKTALTPAANEVLIGASAAATLVNLMNAIGGLGVVNTNYGTGTVPNPTVQVIAASATVLTLGAYAGGTGGNAIVLTEAAANYAVSGSGTLSGGSGTDTKTPAGWTKPYTANGQAQAVFRPGSGVQHFFHVDDFSPNATALSKEGQVRGSETASAFLTGTGFFPTVAQVAAGAGTIIRKSAALDATPRVWTVIADDRTCYVMVQTGDVASTYFSAAFGEFYSLLAAGDSYRSIVIGRTPANSGLGSADKLDRIDLQQTPMTTGSHYIPRSYTGLGTAIDTINKFGDSARANMGGSAAMGSGGLPVPDAVSGAIHVAPVHLSQTSPNTVRGRMRGLFHLCHPAGSFTDGDTITGAGAYAGRTFLVLKSSGNAGLLCFDITGAWETN